MTDMTDHEKVARLETALRTERDTLRKQGGPENIKGANAVNTYLQNADTESKLRFANILLAVKERADERRETGENVHPLALR